MPKLNQTASESEGNRMFLAKLLHAWGNFTPNDVSSFVQTSQTWWPVTFSVLLYSKCSVCISSSERTCVCCKNGRYKTKSRARNAGQIELDRKCCLLNVPESGYCVLKSERLKKRLYTRLNKTFLDPKWILIDIKMQTFLSTCGQIWMQCARVILLTNKLYQPHSRLAVLIKDDGIMQCWTTPTCNVLLQILHVTDSRLFSYEYLRSISSQK